MKRLIKLFLITCMIVLCLLTFSSCMGGYQYSDGTLLYREVEAGYEVIDVEDENAHDIEIPSFVNWKPVVSIGTNAFVGDDNVYSIKIPGSVKKIEDYAIQSCCNLLTVSLPNKIQSIGSSNFYECPNLIYTEYDNGKYVGNDSNPYLALVDVTDKQITSCEINKKCKVIASAFFYCEKLESIDIPYGVRAIGNEAFFACKSLKEVNISKTVKIIGYSAFANTKLQAIKIPKGVKEIGDYAFGSCCELVDVELPKSLKKLGYGVFENSLKVVYNEYGEGKYLGNEKNPYLCLMYVNDENNGELTIHKGTKLIDVDIALSSRKNISAISVDEGNKYFQSIDGILYSKNGKTLVRYPSAKVDESFTVLKKVHIIGQYAFKGCRNLKTIQLPNSIKKIGIDAFNYCVSLESINIPKKIKVINDRTFANCNALTNIEIPKGVKVIGKSAFYACHSLTSIEIPKNVWVIGESAFANCKGLTSVTIPDNVVELNYGALKDCDNLEEVTLGKGISSISPYLFRDCKSLKIITFGSNVAEIGRAAIMNCDALDKINFNGTMEEWLAIEKHTDNMNGNRWNNGAGNYAVYCKDGILDKNDNKSNK